MIGKLIIIGIIIATIAILVPNASKLFPGIPSLDTVKDKIDRATSDKQTFNASQAAIKGIGMGGNLVNSIESATNSISNENPKNNSSTTVYQLAPQYVTQQNYTGQVFDKTGNTCQISVPDLAQTINGKKQLTGIIQLDKCSANLGDPVQVIKLTAKPNSPPVSISSGLEISPYSSSSSVTTPPGTTPGAALPTLPAYYDTVKLAIVNQGTGAALNFEDSSGQTRSVTVTMRNSDTVIFTGTFYSSKFTTDVKDIPNTPHIIEMTIDNAVYGILHASAYAPSSMQNSTITGILSQ